MLDLKCSMRQCEHNEQFCCCAKSINVNQEGDCDAYKKTDRRRNLLFEIGSIELPSRAVDTEITCSATDCVFNHSEVCAANGITVLSGKTENAECATYLKR